jgi:hypothetical protein
MDRYDEDPTIYSGHYEAEITIDRPVARVWVQYLNIGSWVCSHEVEVVYGQPDTVGSITRVSYKRAKELAYEPALYHYCKIIQLIYGYRYLLKSYSERGGSYGWNFIAFDDTRFFEADGRTKVVFNFYAEYKAKKTPVDWAVLDQGMEDSRQGMLNNLGNLKKLVELS